MIQCYQKVLGLSMYSVAAPPVLRRELRHLAQGVLGGSLQENCLAIEDRKGFLETSNFGGTTLYTLFIRYRLCNAPFFDTFVVLHHCIKLVLNTRSIGGCFCGF